MKRGVSEKLAFILILLVFLCSGVFAVEAGKCNIIARASCDNTPTNGFVVMGLSYPTNAHGELVQWEKTGCLGVSAPCSSLKDKSSCLNQGCSWGWDWSVWKFVCSGTPTSCNSKDSEAECNKITGCSWGTGLATGDYPYVLCCNFGTGSRSCTGTNKIIGLSSSTNAHAESPDRTTYSTKVCYEDLVCGKYSSTCPTDYIGVLSLSAETNAHIGSFNSYPVKICCGGVTSSLSTCTLKSASWITTTAVEGTTVQMKVIGSGQECNDNSILFQVYEDGGLGSDTLITEGLDPSDGLVNFEGDTAIAEWTTIWHSGLVNPQYYFNASLVSKPSISINTQSATLTVTERKEETCDSVLTCKNYKTQEDCNSDRDLCDVARDTAPEDVDCTDLSNVCGCVWNTETSKCEFVLDEIGDPECGTNYTLCYNPILKSSYCYFGNECPAGENSSCDYDLSCDSGEGCLCSDCNGKQDSCITGATCSVGTCYSSIIPIQEPLCEFGYTLCRNPSKSRDYCYPGSQCPSGHNPLNNNNGSCDIGEGCLSADCKNGDQDTCSNSTYCSGGMCYSVTGPKVLGSCKISQTLEKDCDEEPTGYKILKWTGTWTKGTPSGAAYERCITGGSINVPCPAQIQLPFFDYYEIGMTLIVIALIYLSMIFRRKIKRRKNK
jgi:hypothetical protein